MKNADKAGSSADRQLEKFRHINNNYNKIEFFDKTMIIFLHLYSYVKNKKKNKKNYNVSIISTTFKIVCLVNKYKLK